MSVRADHKAVMTVWQIIGAPRPPADFAVGDRVETVSYYHWPGEVRSVFTTRAGKTCVAVECTQPGVEGVVQIYSPEQIRKYEE
jgi:hypothetical protein